MKDLEVCVDVDDLICEEQIIEHLQPLKEAVSHFHVTAYAVPNRLGPVHDLKKKYPWITFAMHGFEHTHFECAAWSVSNAKYFLEKATKMGYEDLFKPPNWIMDIELEEALLEEGITLHHHPSYKPYTKGLRVFPGYQHKHEKPFAVVHTHILNNPATDFITDHPGFKPELLKPAAKFITPFDRAFFL